jgi:hypothetical protein
MLKFSVQTFYQPLFSNSFAFSSLSPALSLQQFISLPKPPTSKSLASSKSLPSPKKQKHLFTQEAKSLMSSFSESFLPSGKQGGAVVLREWHDIVTGETCIPATLNFNNLGEAAVLHIPLL